jgi:hypothetical protein
MWKIELKKGKETMQRVSNLSDDGDQWWFHQISDRVGASPPLWLMLMVLLVNDQSTGLHLHKDAGMSTNVNHLVLDLVRKAVVECMCKGSVIPNSICRILWGWCYVRQHWSQRGKERGSLRILKGDHATSGYLRYIDNTKEKYRRAYLADISDDPDWGYP